MSTLGELWQKICQHLAKIALRFGSICQSVNVDHIFGEDIVNVRECWFGAVHKCANLVDLKKYRNMKITCKTNRL